MSEESFDWVESDERYAKYESENEIGAGAIYKVNCPECGEELWNDSFDPDADTPSWGYECDDCGIGVRVRPTKVDASAYDI